MPTLPGESHLSRVVLGEHELVEVAREDDALTVFRARSTVDGGTYTVALLRNVSPTSGATEIAGAAARASRLAMGIPGLLPLLAARTDDGHVWAVRRGEPGRGAERELDRPRTFREAHAIVAGAGKALIALHDISQFHGAITPFALVRIEERDVLDWAGLSLVAEASGGTRSLAEVLPRGFRPPELAGDIPASVGPWSDVHAFARVIVALLTGTHEPRGDLEGLELPTALQKALEAALAVSPARRPSDVSTLLAALASAGDGRAVSGFVAPVTASSNDAAHASPPSVEGTVTEESPGPEPAPTQVAMRGSPSPSPVVPPAPAAAPSRPAPEPAPPAAPEPAPAKKRDPLSTLIAASGIFALLLFAGGLVGAGVLVVTAFRTSASGTSPVVTPPVVPVPAPGPASPTPSPLGPDPSLGTPSPAPVDKGPVAFAPRPSGEIATSKEDEDALLPILADDPVRGDRRAPVTMVIFADPTCPHSARLLSNVPALEDSLGSTLRVVVKTYPLPERAGAMDAAEAALAVRKKGGSQAFFAFLLAVGRSNGRVDGGSLEEAAIKAGAPAGAVTEALRAHAEKGRVEANIVQGRRMAVTATPVVFLNGRRFDGLLPPQFLENEIKAEAIRARSQASRSASPDQVYKARVFSNVTTAESDGPRR